MNEVYTLLSNRPCPLSAVGEFFSLRTGPTTDPYHVRAHKRNMQKKKSHRGIRVHSYGSSVCVCRVVTEWSQFAWPQSIIIDGRYRHFANNLFYSQQFFFLSDFAVVGIPMLKSMSIDVIKKENSKRLSHIFIWRKGAKVFVFVRRGRGEEKWWQNILFVLSSRIYWHVLHPI